MATIQDITQAASYRGDPNIGGAIGTGVTIDPSPLQRLATFTFYRDRDLFEKKKVDDAAAAAKIAMLSAFDINSPLKEYTEDLTKGIGKLREYLRTRPDALHYDKDPEGYQELNQMYGELQIKRQRATVNDVLYNRDLAAIEKLPEGPDKEAQLKLLKMGAEDLFSEGIDRAYSKQLKASPDLKPEDYNLPPIPTSDVFTLDRNANDLIVNGRQYIDMGRLKALSYGEYLKLNEGKLDVDSQEFKDLPERERTRRQLAATITNKKLSALNNTAQSINTLVEEAKTRFVDANGQPIPIENVPEAELGKAGSTVSAYIRSVREFNKGVDEINKVTGRNFEHIDLNNGATPDELIQLDFFNKNGGTLYKELKPDVNLTDNQLQATKMANDKEQWKAELKWDKDKFAETLKGPDQTKSAAVAFGEGLLNDLGTIASITTNSGSKVLTPDDIRKLTADQRKWLGQELPAERDETTGIIKQSAGITPLALAADEVMEITKDGKIYVMKTTGYDAKKKQYSGKWDNGKSTTIDNVIRLVLNEENKNAGNKEINNYTPLDIRGRKPTIFVTESGGSQSVSTSTSTGTRQPGATYTVTDPLTGAVKGTDWTETEAANAKLKGFTITQNK